MVPSVKLPKDKDEGLRLTTGPVPVPARLTDCWLPAALLLLSVMVKEAVRLPVAVGVNVTLIVQLLPAVSELPQLLVCAKSPGLVPVSAMLLMVRVAFPVLLSVAVWAVLVVPTLVELKLRLAGETLAEGALPVPVTLTACGLVVALSVIVREAVRVPQDVGANVTLIVQVPPATMLLLQVLVSAKSPGLAPANVMLVMDRDAFPVLLRVTDWAALVVLTDWLAKVKLEGERPTTGPLPVPLRLIVCGLPAALSVIVTAAVRFPVATGVKVTLIMQLLVGASELPQVLV